MIKNRIAKVSAALFAGTLAFSGAPTVALAVTSDDVAKAQQELSELAFLYANADAEYQDAQGMLADTEEEIADTEEKIEQKREELKTAQGVLSDHVVADYKSGGITLLSLLVSSASFDELASNMYYANKIVEQDVNVINEVNRIQDELDQEMTSLSELQEEQEQLVEDKRVYAEELAVRESNQSAYVDGLSEELRQQIAAEDARRIAAEQQQAAQISAAVDAGTAQPAQSTALTLENNANNNGAGNNGAGNNGATTTNNNQQSAQSYPTPTSATTEESTTTSAPEPTVSTPEPTPAPAPSYDEPEETSTGTGSLTSSERSAIVAAAYSQVGLPYGHDNIAGVNWDCSGLVAFAYASAGRPVSAYSLDQIYMIQNTSSLQPGDVIGWLGNVPGGNYERHVALYIGDGMILHANGSRVAVESLGAWSPYTNGGPLL